MRTFYHLSPHCFDELDPAKSQGSQKRAWLCTGSKIPWAIKHLAAHHGKPIRWVYEIRVSDYFLRKHMRRHRRGIYTTRVPLLITTKDYIR